MESVAIVGVGLIGGSFGLALRAAGFAGRIVGVSSPSTIGEAIARGAIDRGVSLDEAAAESDLIYLAQPISVIGDTLDRIGSVVRAGTLITDAGSTKVEIVLRAKNAVTAAVFLGGHPMAGKESRGVSVASADLFRDRPYILTPSQPSDMDTPVVSVFVDWLKRLGANTVAMSPQDHDRAVAFISHLPQMVSTALAACLDESLEPNSHLDLAGPGLVDMSRLALSSYDIWQDIVATNTENIEHALSVYIDKLTELRDNLQTLSLQHVFAAAAGVAYRIRRQTQNKGQA